MTIFKYCYIFLVVQYPHDKTKKAFIKTGYTVKDV